MLAFLAGCHHDDPDGRRPPDTVPPPYFETPTTAPPAFDRAAVEAGLDEAVAVVPGLDAAPAIAIYRELRDYGDPGCPASYPYGGYEYWYAQCTAESGAIFSGYSYEYAYDYGSGYEYTGIYIYGAMVAPDGRALSSTGEFVRTDFGRSSDDKVRLVLDGVFDWTGDAEPGSWIARHLVPGVVVVSERPRGAHVWRVDGGISGFEGPVDTLEYAGIAFDDRDCSEPVGTISVRLPEGEWFDVTFGGVCDGCGQVANRGVPVGEACTDFAPWMRP